MRRGGSAINFPTPARTVISHAALDSVVASVAAQARLSCPATHGHSDGVVAREAGRRFADHFLAADRYHLDAGHTSDSDVRHVVAAAQVAAFDGETGVAELGHVHGLHR